MSCLSPARLTLLMTLTVECRAIHFSVQLLDPIHTTRGEISKKCYVPQYSERKINKICKLIKTFDMICLKKEVIATISFVVY